MPVSCLSKGSSPCSAPCAADPQSSAPCSSCRPRTLAPPYQSYISFPFHTPLLPVLASISSPSSLSTPNTNSSSPLYLDFKLALASRDSSVHLSIASPPRSASSPYSLSVICFGRRDPPCDSLSFPSPVPSARRLP
ncbi:hypothetical protein L1887_59190 [Cichorium endivia]|nr:hypothetical protein L1887_59190 [Cichorium endivia]